MLKSIAFSFAATLALAANAHAQDTPPAADKPADATTPATSAPQAGQAAPTQLEIVTLPDGRQALVFPADAAPATVPGNVEKVTLPDGRIAFAFGPVPEPPVPGWAAPVVRLDPARQVTYATGDVANKATLLTVPYLYRKTFRVKTDVMYKPLFSKDLKVDVPAGSVGFYSGNYQKSGGAFGAPAEMLCIFPASPSGDFTHISCYLRDLPAITGAPWSPVGTYGLVPTYYSIMTYYGSPQYTAWGPADTEDTDTAVPHDFSLTLHVVKWTDTGPVLGWNTIDGTEAKRETPPLAPDGTVSVALGDGKLVLSRDPNDKHMTHVEFVPASAAAAPAAQN